MNAAAVFSERRFPGYAAWFGIFYSVAVLSGLLSVFALSRVQDGGMLDATRIFILAPLGWLVGIALAVAVLSRALRLSVKACLQALTAWLPLLLLAGAVDAIAAALGFQAGTDYFNIPLAGFAFVTAGLAPHPVASLGTAALLIAGVFLVFRAVRSIRGDVRAAIRSAVIVYAGGMFLLLIPSVVSWFGLSEGLSVWSAGSVVLRRAMAQLVMNGYWWSNLYERFPFTLGNETDIAIRLFLGAIAFAAFACVVIALSFRLLSSDRRVWRRILRGEWLGLPFVLAGFGWFLAVTQGGMFFGRGSNLIAVLVLALTLLCAWLYAVAQNDLQDIAIDEQNGARHPLVTGDIAIADLKEASVLYLVCAIAGAWILGWPVLFCLLAYGAARFIYDVPPLRLKRLWPANACILALSQFALVLAGWFFGIGHANLAKFPSGLAVGLLFSFVALAALKDVKDQTGDRVHGMQTLPLRVPAGRMTSVVAVALGAGYLILPLVTGWWHWSAVAIPIAGASVFFAFAKPFSERPLRRLFLLFYLVSGLLLASGWLVA